MIQEYIDTYPQGIGLSVQQKQHFSTHEDSTPAVHSLLLPLSLTVTTAQIKKRADDIEKQQLILKFGFEEVVGFRGLRQVPKINTEVVIESASNNSIKQSVVEHAQLIPVSLDIGKGQNIQINQFEYQGQGYLLIQANALVLDIASLYQYATWLLDTHIVLPEAVQYPDFLAWVEEVNNTQESAQGHAYWQTFDSKLSSLDTAFQLPYHKASTTTDLQTQRVKQVSLDSALVASVSELAEKLDLDSDIIFQAIWWLLLARVSGNSGFSGAMGYDPRQISEELEGALGVYQLHLPLLIQIDPAQTLTTWLTQFSFQCEQHVEWAETYKGIDNFKPSCIMQVWHGELNGQLLRLDDNSELHLSCILHNDKADLVLRYQSQSYSDEAVIALLTQYQHILGYLNDALKLPVVELSIATAEESVRHLSLNKDVKETVPLLLEQLSKHTAIAPQEIGLQDNLQSYSYQEMSETINYLAQVFITHGVNEHDVVTLLLPRSVEQVLVVLAIQSAGAAYCPIDPAWPIARQQQIRSVANAKLHIEEYVTAENFALVTLFEQAKNLSEQAILPKVSSQHCAYLLFTSGSTGAPKGVMVEHGQLAQYCHASSQALELNKARYALTSTVAADIGNTCLFNAFYNGGTLVVASEQAVLEGQAFAKFVSEQHIDIIKIVPSHIQALLESEPKKLPNKIILGGEASSPGLLQKIHRLSPSTEIFNHYGPTETTVGVLSHQYTDLNSFAGTVPKLSKVFAGTQVYILNSQDKLCGIGEQGELYIAGKQLAKGYLGKTPEEGFVTGSQWAERLYPTGDLARYMPDNTISLLGRKDDQVQIRGFRVEPNEVATCITHALDGTTCFVVAQSIAGQIGLVAYLTGFTYQDQKPLGLLGNEINQYLQTYLREQLPEVMVPQFFIALDKFPLLVNGKIDRTNLPKASELQSVSYLAPNTQLEIWLANSLADILDTDKVSCDVSFFDLGGHSLVAIKWVTRIKKQLLMDIDPSVIFDNSTIIKLANALIEQHTSPEKLEKIAMTQLKLALLSPEQRESLLHKLGLGN